MLRVFNSHCAEAARLHMCCTRGASAASQVFNSHSVEAVGQRTHCARGTCIASEFRCVGPRATQTKHILFNDAFLARPFSNHSDWRAPKNVQDNTEQRQRRLVLQYLAGAFALASSFGIKSKVVYPEEWSLSEQDCYDKEFAGEGGFGKVWFVKLKTKPGQFALKQVPILDENELLDVENELKFMRELNGSRFVSLEHAALESEASASLSTMHILMEAATGGDFLNAVNKKQLKREDVARLFVQVLEGISEMHERGFVHRDIKLENILISKPINEGGKAKIADLGVACAQWGPLESVAPCVKQDWRDGWRRISGTDMYMSPEILAAERKKVAWTSEDVQTVNDPKVDMWALGIVLHAMLTGRMLFDSKYDIASFRFQKDHMPYCDDTSACKLMAQLLETDSAKRPSAKDVLPLARAWASEFDT